MIRSIFLTDFLKKVRLCNSGKADSWRNGETDMDCKDFLRDTGWNLSMSEWEMTMKKKDRLFPFCIRVMQT